VNVKKKGLDGGWEKGLDGGWEKGVELRMIGGCRCGREIDAEAEEEGGRMKRAAAHQRGRMKSAAADQRGGG